MSRSRSAAVQQALKRACDVGLAAGLLVVLAPVMAAIALAVACSSPGGAVFRQRRIGRAGTPFTILKFRTMHPPSPDWAHLGTYCYTDDPRVTRVGRFLRATSLDELPQLLNVLRGDMSFVGPRPDLPEHVARYDEVQRRRLSVRPGITGWAQVNGRNELSWPRRIELDLEYLDGWSLWRDAAIAAATLKVVLSRRGQALPARLGEDTSSLFEGGLDGGAGRDGAGRAGDGGGRPAGREHHEGVPPVGPATAGGGDRR